MKKLILLATLAAIATGCATKSRTTDIKGMFISDSGQLAIGYVHVDAIPEGTESAVIHYKEDVALLAPSKPTHDIDITLTGTNAVNSAEGIVEKICGAFIAVRQEYRDTRQKYRDNQDNRDIRQETGTTETTRTSGTNATFRETSMSSGFVPSVSSVPVVPFP